MRILLLLSAIPYDRGEAIEVVSYEVARLMTQAANEVFVQTLIREGLSDASARRERYADQLLAELTGLHLLPTIYIGDLLPIRSRLAASANHLLGILRSLPGVRRMVSSYLFPAVVAKPAVAKQVEAVRPDVIVSIWSWEALAASYDIRGVPKFVYYGNPNHKPPEVQFRYPKMFDIDTHGLRGRFKLGILKLLNRAREIQHLRMMNRCEATANNALIDAQYYCGMGHPRSIYLQNMWPDAKQPPCFGGNVTDGTMRLCGSVGNLGATGNTFALHYLGTELLPRLKKRTDTTSLIVDIFGGGRARAAVLKYLTDPCIHLRGWVEDIESEVLASAGFLVLTNAYGFNVGNTRILLAWSLGACVIAHSSSALSMPEMVHGHNALLGETPDQIADLILQALHDSELREQIGRGGYATFHEYYRSEKVVPRMLAEIARTVSEFRERTNPC